MEASRAEIGLRGRELPNVSSEIYSIELGEDRYLLYAPLRQSAFVCNARVVNLLAELRDGRYHAVRPDDDALIEFLRQLQFVDGGPEVRPDESPRGLPRPTAVTLFLTTVCNLRCTYCYASAGDTPERRMSIDTAKRGIRFVARNAKALGKSRIDVAYHGGGEPTAQWDVLVESFEYGQRLGAELGLEVRAGLASNGVFSARQCDWIVQNLSGVSLSFDGLPEVHDRHRLTVMGQGSSAVVMKTLERFDKAGFNYGLRMTVTRDQLPKLAASVEFVCARFKPARIQVEPAYALGRWTEAPSAETEEFIAAYREARERAKEHGRDIGFSAARVGLITNHFCGVTRDSFALSPDGNVSGCYEVFSEDDALASTFFYGRPSTNDDGYDFDLAVLDRLRSQTVEHREYCSGCFAKWHCAGDCLNKAYKSSGTLEFEGSDRCHITRELTKDQILERIVASGGLYWHGVQE